jgi:hypothetical protein
MITEIIEGEGISVVASSGKVILTNTLPGRNSIGSIEVTGQTTIDLKRPNDTITISAGNAIKILTDPGSNKIIFSVDTTNLAGTFNGDVNGDTVSANTLKISSNKDPVKLQHEELIKQYSSLQDNAIDIRKNILALQSQLVYWQQNHDVNNNLINIQSQISNQETVLLDIDKQTSKVVASLKLIELSLSDVSATFSYNPFNMVLSSNRTLATSIILQNMSTIQRNAIIQPTNGRMIYNTSTDKIQAFAAGTWVDLH